MALTLEQLKKMVEAEGLHYFVDPTRDALMIGMRGMHGTYQFVMLLDMEGKFLQFRTLSYLFCPPQHPHLLEALKALGEINYRTRLVKYGWDPKDGEIMAYADYWIMDGTLTQQQLNRMLGNYVPVIDTGYARLKSILDTGKDPGEEDPQKSVERLLGALGPSLPPEVAKLLEKLRGKKAEPPGGQGPTEV